MNDWFTLKFPFTFICVCTHVYMFMHMCVHMCVCVWVIVHSAYMCIYLCVLVSVCVQAHLYVCMNKHVEIKENFQQSVLSSPIYFYHVCSSKSSGLVASASAQWAISRHSHWIPNVKFPMCPLLTLQHQCYLDTWRSIALCSILGILCENVSCRVPISV